MRPSLPHFLVLATALGSGLPVFAAASETKSSATAKKRYAAVMDLGAQGVDKAAAKVLSEALGDEMLRLRGLRIMERSQMESVLREQGFQQSGACDASDCAAQIGKLLGIDLMILGSVGRIGSTHTISVRAVDVATGEVVASTRRSVKGEIDQLLTESVHPVARELLAALGADPTTSAAAAKTDASATPLDTLVDPRDDQRYPYARIGRFLWTLRNMNYRLSDFNSWCYEDAKANCEFLGRLYNWNKATLACPVGWHLPTSVEWEDLVASLGGPRKAAEAMRGPAGGKDNSLFRARAGGFRDPEGNYVGIGGFSVWWTATEVDGDLARTQSLDFAAGTLEADPAAKENGYSVRCVKPAF